MTAVDPSAIAERIATLSQRIDAAGGHEVTVVAVSKTFGPDAIDAAVGAGLTNVGENYAQEMVDKIPQVASSPTVHFIGRLQRNKIRRIAPFVDVWQSVDRSKVAVEIAKRSPGAKIMVQVDISGEENKGGCAVDEIDTVLSAATDHGLEVIGLMGVALLAEPEHARPGFALLRRLVDRYELEHCSMGMSADLEVAIDEGTTMVRVGSDIFGPRVR